MRNRIIHPARPAALLAAWLFLPLGLFAQAGIYTVRIKQPVADTIRKCPGESILFMAEGQNADGKTFDNSQVVFTWDLGYNGQVITGPNASFNYPAGGHYIVRLYVTGVTGPPAQNIPELHVFIGMKPNFTATRSDKTSFCDGNEITLTGFVTPRPWTGDSFPFTNIFLENDYDWEGTGIQSDRNGISRVQPPLDQGHLIYRFMVEDDFGCIHDTSLTVYGVYAGFTMEPTNGEAPLDVTFTVDTSSNGGNEGDISYLWEYVEKTDTTSRASSPDTLHTFEIPGVYTCRMIATYLQCSYVFTHEEYIRVDSSLLEIPNVFTPNEDGANDYFQVKGHSLKTFEGVIFNRWGKKVFEWTDPKTLESGWNGRVNNTGNLCPSGTYYYVIRATGYDKDKISERENETDPYPDIRYEGGVYKGFLTLIR